MGKLLAFLSGLLLTLSVHAAGSNPMQDRESKAIKTYNQGVTLMYDEQYSKAEKKFRSALKRKKNWAEAHNNLAFTLRMQGEENYQEALSHYNKAIALSNELPEPYMYRGVLHVQMGNPDLANKDLQILASLSNSLATELSYVIENGAEKQPTQFFGVSPKHKSR